MKTSSSTALQTLDLLSPGRDLQSYQQAINRVPVLGVERERDLAQQLRDDGSVDAARELVLSHLRFVVYMARSYQGYGLPMADLIQEGNVGLMKAVKRFDPSFGVRLITFASHWIKAEIHKYVLQNWRMAKVATTKSQRKLFFNLRRNKKGAAWLSTEEADAIAKDLKVMREDVFDMEERMASRDLSFDAGVDDDGEGFNPALVEAHEDSDSNPALLVESADWKEKSQALITEALASLDDRSRDILKHRWLMGEDRATLHQLAEKYQISAERVRQLEQSGMKKIRKMLSEELSP